MTFKKLISRKSNVIDPIGELAEKISSVSATRSFNNDNLAGMMFATEGIDQASEQTLTSVYNNLEATIKTIADDFKIAAEDYQLTAASVAGILSTNPSVALSHKLSLNTPHALIPSQVADGYIERPFAVEAYDERDNRNSQTYSIIYNLYASRQDEFGDALFPTIVVNPNEVGITISATIFYAYNDLKRSVTGSPAPYARKNVIRAYADASILKNEQTKAIPVLRATGGADDNSDKFAPVADIAPWAEDVGCGITVPTSALRVGKTVDLIGLSQTNELLNNGIMGPSDSLDTYIKLKKAFFSVTEGGTTDVFAINTEDNIGSTFTYAPQGNYRKMIMNLESDSFVLDATSLNAAGTALSASTLTELVGRRARVRVSATGQVVIDKGDFVISSGKIELVALRDAADNLVTGAVFNSLAAKLDAAELKYVVPEAFRANSNLRQRGQLFDTQIEHQIVQIPYRAPVSVIMPAINNGGDDTTPLKNLVLINGVRTSNDAVTTLFKFANTIKSYVGVADQEGNLPEVSAIGRYYFKPVHFSEDIVLSNTVDSRNSYELYSNIRASIIEKIRFYANEMYRQSEYKSAALMLTGNADFRPTVIVATDQVIHNYLMADGDLRTLGTKFDIKIVSSVDTRMTNKMFLTFGVFDSSRNNAINPLNFGNMLWSSELTVVLPIDRAGQTSKELIVAPRYVHIVNLPVLTELTITGLPAVTGKIALNTHTV